MKLVYLLAGVIGLTIGLSNLPFKRGYVSDIERVSSYVDERSDLIARMKKTVACQDTAKEDPRDKRDKIVSSRECVLLLEDFGFNDEFVYDGSAVSIGPEKNGSDITLFIYAGTYTTPKTISLPDAKKYLAKREKK